MYTTTDCPSCKKQALIDWALGIEVLRCKECGYLRIKNNDNGKTYYERFGE